MRRKAKVPRFRTNIWALTARAAGTRCSRLEHPVNKAWAVKDQRLFTKRTTREHYENQMGEEPKLDSSPILLSISSPSSY